MNVPSPRVFIIVGFVISLTAVVLNTIVLSFVNSRLRAADAEYFELQEALAKQTAQLNEADLKFDLYRIMHNMSFSTPAARTEDARDDAKEILKGFLVKFYAAANDISPTDVTRVAVDEAGEAIPRLNQIVENLKTLEATSDPAERARLAAEIETLTNTEPAPRSELGRKLREIGKFSEAESSAASETELISALLPIMKSFREQIVDSIRSKEARMQELHAERANLTRRSTNVTYAAIALQIFGLMFIMTKDIAKDLTPRPA